MISARNAFLTYDDHGRSTHACNNISIEIGSGEFVGILGPSGSGKSSLLYLLSGLKQPTSGDIFFEGKNITRYGDAERSRLRLNSFGFVFQQPYLLGYLTAAENVLAARGQKGDFAEAMALLEKLGIAEKAHRHPHELSVGERQRVCVARALFGKPAVIFADEPTAALDHTTGLHVVDLLNAHKGAGCLVMVTHDPSMLEAANRVLTIQDGELVDTAACGK